LYVASRLQSAGDMTLILPWMFPTFTPNGKNKYHFQITMLVCACHFYCNWSF